VSCRDDRSTILSKQSFRPPLADNRSNLDAIRQQPMQQEQGNRMSTLSALLGKSWAALLPTIAWLESICSRAMNRPKIGTNIANGMSRQRKHNSVVL
jgi:hypothetical protein